MEKFVKALLARMQTEAELTAALVKHPGLVGSSRELAIADLIRQFVPTNFEVLSGGVLDSKSQMDVMIVDTSRFPTPIRTSSYAIVLPEALMGFVEVKSSLVAPRPFPTTPSPKKHETFLTVMVQLGKCRMQAGMGAGLFSALVAFKGPKSNQQLRKWLGLVLIERDNQITLQQANQSGPSPHQLSIDALQAAMMPDLILVDSGPIAIKMPSATQSSVTEYVFIKTEKEAASMAVLVAQVASRIPQFATPDVAQSAAYAKLVSLVAKFDPDDDVQPIQV